MLHTELTDTKNSILQATSQFTLNYNQDKNSMWNSLGGSCE